MRIGYLFALFPRARFVFVQRDGRDNISSLMDAWRARGPFGLRQVLGDFPERVAIDNGRFDQWMLFLPPGWRAYNQASLEEVCAFQWLQANRLALEARDLVPDSQWVHVRYEDTFDRPVDMFREIFARLELPFDEEILKRCETLLNRPRSVVSGDPRRGKWRERNREAIERILPTIAPMMERLNYSID
jgi:Sulfotransferase family